MGKVSLILLAAFLLTLLILHLMPQREMNIGGCGPRALHAVAMRLGNTQSEEETMALFPRNGYEVTLEEMAQMTPQLGLKAQATQMTIAELQRSRPMGVLHVDETHFVALVGYTAGGIDIVDSLYKGETRPVRWRYDDLKTRWDGTILIVAR